MRAAIAALKVIDDLPMPPGVAWSPEQPATKSIKQECELTLPPSMNTAVHSMHAIFESMNSVKEKIRLHREASHNCNDS